MRNHRLAAGEDGLRQKVINIIEADVREKLNQIFSGYRGSRDELIPILQEVQEHFRYLPLEVMRGIARFLKLSESTVYGVATFYAQFKFAPSGRRVVRVCRGTACHVRGGAHILREVEKHLGIKPGETTQDQEYNLETVACIGACALAPAMMIDNNVHGRMITAKIEPVLGKKKVITDS